MAIYAVITNGIVTNRIVAEEPDIAHAPETFIAVTGINPEPQIGWTYAGGTFTAPSN